MFLAAAAGLAGAAFLTRGISSLGYDELFTVWLCAQPWGEVIPQANQDGFTPPLFYFLVKLLSLTGLRNEDLRILPIAFASLAVISGLDASRRLFGASSLRTALAVIPVSACLFTFAHELRPYSALLACVFFVLGRLGVARDPSSAHPRDDRFSALAALLATALSYLGLSLVVVWVAECRRRRPQPEIAAVVLAALALCAPGFAKALKMGRAASAATIEWSATSPSLSGVFFGLAPMPAGGWIESLAVILLIATLVWIHRSSNEPALLFLSRAFLLLLALLVGLDVAVPIGFAPRYAVLVVGALLLLIIGVVCRTGRFGRFAAGVLLALNLLAIGRYLSVEPAPREDWRRAMDHIEERLGPEGVLLAFPFHHAAVAAHAYAPALKVGGGYTSRNGPVFWYEPPAAFKGYSFADLTRLREPATTLRRLSRLSDICLFTDEADSAKTAAVFKALEDIGSTTALDTGDPRLRARCRSKG